MRLRFSYALVPALLLSLTGGCGDDNPTPMSDGGLDGAMPDGGMDSGMQGPPGCNPGVHADPEGETCAGDPAPLASGEACEITAGNENVLITADLLLPGNVQRGGQVLIDGSGTIVCASCDCSGEALAAGATTVVCPDAVLSPGLINGHDHLPFSANPPQPRTEERYEHRHDWRRGGVRDHNGISSAPFGSGSSTEQREFIEIRQVMSGTTSIFGQGSADGLARNIDNAMDQEGLDQGVPDYQTFPLGDASSQVLTADGCSAYSSSRDTTEDATSVEAYVPHVAEGIDAETRNEFLCQRDGNHDLVQPNAAFIHGVGLLPGDIAEMGTDGTMLIWSPRTNISLYGDTARVTEYDRLGVPIALGTDWLISGSMNMLRELACADEFNQLYLDGYFSDEQLWRMATINSAQALGVDDAIGSIAVGLQADLVLYDARVLTDYRAVIGADPEDVLLVIRGGQVLYGDSALVDEMPASESCEPLMVPSDWPNSTCGATTICGVAKSICLVGTRSATSPRDTCPEGSTALECILFDIEGRRDRGEPYPLCFCDDTTPENEPTCIPERNGMDASYPAPSINGSNTYVGMSTMDDQDGDGIPNESDNCECTFNPIRPLDNGVQADADADGIGDACDVCPIGGDEDPSTCVQIDPNDRDNDGTPNETDNCPDLANDQTDTDMDGKGDACDVCPMDPNPGNAACPTTIYDIKDGTLPLPAQVAIPGSIVTAIGSNFFLMQVDPASDGYDGVEYSGVFVHTGGTPEAEDGTPLAVGMVVDVTSAQAGLFPSNPEAVQQRQLSDATISITSMGATVPAPVLVTPAEIAPTTMETMRAMELEGVLVTLNTVTVDAIDAAENTFESMGVLFDDSVYRVEPFPVVSETFDSITGPLVLSQDRTRVYPRSSDDVVGGTPVLLGFSPETLVYAREGASGPTFPTELRVVLSRAVSSDTEIMIAGMGGATAMNVTVPMGSASVAVPVTGVTPSATPATITASYDGRMESADVRVLGATEVPDVLAIEPSTINVPIMDTVDFDIVLAHPAPAGGITLTLATTLGMVDASVMVMENDDRVRVTLTGPAMEGTGTLTVMGNNTVMATVSAAASFGTLLFSEYIESSSNKAIEIYNGTGAPADLSSCVVQLYSNANTTPNTRNTLDLSMVDVGLQTLAAGATLVICNDMAISAACQVESGVTNFNGNDAFELVCGGMVIDVFGTYGGDTTYEGTGFNSEDTAIRRLCSVTEGDTDGEDAFDLSEWEEAGSGSNPTRDGLGTHCE